MVAGGRNRSCMSDEGVFGVKICPTARENRCKGFERAVKICCEVSTNRAGVVDMGGFSEISAVSCPISSVSA